MAFVRSTLRCKNGMTRKRCCVNSPEFGQCAFYQPPSVYTAGGKDQREGPPDYANEKWQITPWTAAVT